MWRLVLKIPVGRQLFGILAFKNKVDISGYPLKYYHKNGKLYCIFAGLVIGSPKNKKSFIRDLKKRKEVINFEYEGDFAILTVQQPNISEPYYNPRIIRPSPSIILGKGIHIWDLASFVRKDLEKVIAFSVKYLDAKIVYFRNEKLKNISFTKLIPELTEKQKEAINLAIDKGYYDYPKKSNLEFLAKIMGISYSTYQAHLKKAEGKLIKSSVKEAMV